MSPLLGAKQQTFVFRGDFGGQRVRLDRRRIAQVVMNLVSNASKYSPAGTTITFEGSIRDSTLHLAVIDEGIGISSEDLSRILKILLDKGFIIKHPPPSSYTPLHPRMALTNAYQLIQQEYDKRLKEKRLMVDQISFMLEGIYEKRLLGTEPDKTAR